MQVFLLKYLYFAFSEFPERFGKNRLSYSLISIYKYCFSYLFRYTSMITYLHVFLGCYKGLHWDECSRISILGFSHWNIHSVVWIRSWLLQEPRDIRSGTIFVNKRVILTYALYIHNFALEIIYLAITLNIVMQFHLLTST